MAFGPHEKRACSVASASTESLRLLVVSRASYETVLPAESLLQHAVCQQVSDLFGALTRLAGGRERFDAIVFSPEVLSRTVLAAFPLIRRHRRIPIWLLDGPAAAEKRSMDQAKALGAVSWREGLGIFLQKDRSAVSEEAPPTDRSTSLSPPLAPLSPPIEGRSAPLSPPDRRPSVLPFSPPAREPVDPVVSGRPVAADPVIHYDAFSRESLLTEAELRALLGGER